MIDAVLVKTKLCLPLYRPGWVPRPDLFTRLNLSFQRRLTVLSAPAGFGKTSLLRAWIQREMEPEGSGAASRFAWLALDEGDQDARRFLTYFTGALNSIGPSVSTEEPANFQPTQPALQRSLDLLLNEVEAFCTASAGTHLVLVLDDYHLITAEPVHQILAYWLERQPDQVHLVIATRADPPLPLARLRARGQLLEIRAEELRFKKDEIQQYLHQSMGIQLNEKDLTLLADRTEGWIAGLQMAALAMLDESSKLRDGRSLPASAGHLSAFVNRLSGSNRYIMDFLMEEVFQRQPEMVQTFLLKTSILERMSAPLCEAVLESGDSRGEPRERANGFHESPLSILEYLDRANLFIVPLDDRREWYRYHRLFADLLRKRLHLTFPGLIPELHRRASEWFEQNDALEEAIEHAFAAEEEKRAAGLVAQAAEGLLIRGEFVTLRGWLDRLPEAQLSAWPNLCAYHAWTLFLSNATLKQVEARLALIPKAEPSQTGKAAALRAYIAIFQGLIPQAAIFARQALEELPEEETFLRSMAFIIQASTELSEGDPEAGQRALEQAVQMGEAAGNVLASVIALVGLAENHRKLGRLRQAETLFRQAIELSVDLRGTRLPVAGRALCGLGDLLREWNQLEDAERCLEEGIELLEDWGALAIYSGYIALARLRQAQRNWSEALAILQKAARLAAQSKATPIDDWIVAMAQAAACITSGDLDSTSTWVEQRGLLQEPEPASRTGSEAFAIAHLRKYELIVLARLQLAQGQHAEALRLLDLLLPEVVRMSRHGLRVEIQILRALALDGLGKQGEAFSALSTALSLAEPAGYVRLFLDEGERLERLLSEAYQSASRLASRHEVFPSYGLSLLAAFKQETGFERPREPGYSTEHPLQNEIEPLSEREQEVLSLLRSRLTVPEMAEALCVAESTLRSHIKSIYSKLGVHRRADAVERAEELGQ